MGLSSISNNINVLGVFGRLESEQEKRFKDIQKKYSEVSKNDESIDVFNHLSLVVSKNVPFREVSKYTDLLRKLKVLLPLTFNVDDVVVIESKHIALVFDLNETEQIRSVAHKFFPEGVVVTHYMKVIRYVSKINQSKVVQLLKDSAPSVVFVEFVLCANKVSEDSIIYSSNEI